MYPCPWPGCPQSFVWSGQTAVHARRPHGKCTCGRYFTKHGHSAHRGQVSRRGLSHAAFELWQAHDGPLAGVVQ